MTRTELIDEIGWLNDLLDLIEQGDISTVRLSIGRVLDLRIAAEQRSAANGITTEYEQID